MMKKLIGVFLFFYGFVGLSAQELIVYYNVNFKLDSLQEQFNKEEAVLDISKNEVKFYSVEYLKADSIQKQTNKVNFARPKLGYKVKRTLNTSENTEYVTIYMDYYVLSSNDTQNWMILDETKTVNGIVLRKAVTRFGKRDWEAWFSDKYPVLEGPYKFRGLPGLIFELWDTKDNFIFSVNRIVPKKEKIETDNFLETNYGKKALPVKLGVYQKLKLDDYHNPLKGQENLIVMDKDGKPVKIDKREQTLKYQNHLRKYNNPIDLNLAVTYPDKR
ncbi:GLPGLI family protein [Riemerella anatipestifer]|nr:GLPGLI family protein [Riemerella anatipestifer]MDY3534112.1 GLPGLI family protein [Riemerella anatipestifer]MDY3535765.1 GLPGLI family protein [Riemerella anatipestifer]